GGGVKAPLTMIRWRPNYGTDSWPPSTWYPPFGMWHVVVSSAIGPVRTHCGKELPWLWQERRPIEELEESKTLQIVKVGNVTPDGQPVCKVCERAFERYQQQQDAA